MIHRALYPVFLVVLLLAVVSGCKRKISPKISPPEVPVVVVEERDIPIEMEFVGQTYGNSDITIPARVNGFLKGIYFEQGGMVRKGQLLYLIEQGPIQTQVAQAEASLANTQTQLINAQSNYNRIAPLAKINAVSQSDLDDAIAGVGSARAAVRASEAALQYAQIQLGYTRILAPVSGVIGQTNAKVGDYVGLGSPIPILNTVSQIDSILVRFYISDKIYLGLRDSSGGKLFTDIRMMLSNGELYPEPGRFNFVGRAVDPSTASLEVQVSFPNRQKLLKPGQYARISTVVGTRQGALLIPQQCVNALQGAYNVYTVGSNDTVRLRAVTLGSTWGTYWIVESGLVGGERVVLEGFHKLRVGDRILPQQGIFTKSATR